MSSMGNFSVVARGNGLLALKRKLKRRRESLQGRAYIERGKASRGHGRSRRYETNEAISEKESRYIKTLCQQVAARVVRLARLWGCGTVVIEDYGGIEADESRGVRRFVERFPLHQLKTCIEWSCKKEGFALAETPSDYISSECPGCGCLDMAQHNRRTGMFHCRACSFDRDVDFVAALMMLRHYHGNGGVWDERLKQERKNAPRKDV